MESAATPTLRSIRLAVLNARDELEELTEAPAAGWPSYSRSLAEACVGALTAAAVVIGQAEIERARPTASVTPSQSPLTP